MKKVAIYCRVSTEEQARNKEGSITSQIQRLQLKVDEKNIYTNIKWGKVINIYKDEACSGKNTNRPEFQRMLSDIKTKKIDTVMVTELSRLSRSVTDFLSFIKELEDFDCDFVCPQYDFDTTSPAGKVFMTIIMALAQFERELTAERIKNNFYARALRGLANGGHPFLGYDKNPDTPGRWMVNEKEAVIVREIFNSYLAANSVSEVAHSLNSQGIKNKAWLSKRNRVQGGKPFNIDAIWRILTNYSYIGKREINLSNKNISQENLKPEEQYRIVDASWKAIVSPKTFEKVQEKLKLNKGQKHESTYDFILSGLLVCDECGSPLFGKSSTGRNRKHFYYGHKRKTSCRVQSYNAEELEKLIKKRLFSLINHQALNWDFVNSVKEQSKESSKTAAVLLQSKKKETEKLRMENERLVDLISSNELARETNCLLVKIKKNEEGIKKAESELLLLEEDNLVELPKRNCDPQFVLDGIDKLRKDNFRKAKIGKKKAVIGEVIKAIHIHPDNILKIVFWASDFQSREERKEARKQKGVVLPFLKLGRPLAASFTIGAAGGRELSAAKKAAEIGIYALSDNSNAPVVGASAFGLGGAGWTRTIDPVLIRDVL